MIIWKHPRLRLPMLRIVGGSAIAVAFGIGLGWPFALMIEVITIGGAYLLYEISAGDTDLGALVGGRADERQKLIRLKAGTFGLVVTLVATIVAGLIAAAAHAVFWPYFAFTLVIGAGYLTGLAIYGAGREDADNGVTEKEHRPLGV